MSTSRDDLPAVEEPKRTTHDALPIVEETTRKTLMDVRWLLGLSLGSIAAIVTATAATIAFAQDAGVKAVAPVERRATLIEADVAQLKRDSAEQAKRTANIERVVLTIDLNQRLMLKSRGIEPIDVPSEMDGGK